MQTDISRVAKIWLIMMWLIVLSPILVILFVKLVTAQRGREDLTGILIILGCITAIPLILIGIALVCARRLSKSRFALLYYPVIGGLLAAACVPLLLGANLSAHLFLRYGIVLGLVGLVIGGLAFLIRVVTEQHSAKDTPPRRFKGEVLSADRH
jgi:hypothetical protein